MLPFNLMQYLKKGFAVTIVNELISFFFRDDAVLEGTRDYKDLDLPLFCHRSASLPVSL